MKEFFLTALFSIAVLGCVIGQAVSTQPPIPAQGTNIVLSVPMPILREDIARKPMPRVIRQGDSSFNFNSSGNLSSPPAVIRLERQENGPSIVTFSTHDGKGWEKFNSETGQWTYSPNLTLDEHSLNILQSIQSVNANMHVFRTPDPGK